MFLTLISLNLMTFFGSVTNVQPKVPVKSDVCTVTCTVTAIDPSNGASYSFAVTAGGWFVSCETAAQRACDRAYEAASSFIENNQ